MAKDGLKTHLNKSELEQAQISLVCREFAITTVFPRTRDYLYIITRLYNLRRKTKLPLPRIALPIRVLRALCMNTHTEVFSITILVCSTQSSSEGMCMLHNLFVGLERSVL